MPSPCQSPLALSHDTLNRIAEQIHAVIELLTADIERRDEAEGVVGPARQHKEVSVVASLGDGTGCLAVGGSWQCLELHACQSTAQRSTAYEHNT